MIKTSCNRPIKAVLISNTIEPSQTRSIFCFPAFNACGTDFLFQRGGKHRRQINTCITGLLKQCRFQRDTDCFFLCRTLIPDIEPPEITCNKHMYLVWGVFKQMAMRGDYLARIATSLPVRFPLNGWQNLPYPNDSPHDQHPHRQDRHGYSDDAVLFLPENGSALH